MKEVILKNNSKAIIRDITVADAKDIMEYVDFVAGEADNISFGRGEFNMTLEQEENFLKGMVEADNKMMAVGIIDDEIIGLISFSGGHRSRIRHTGEFGLTIKKKCWNLGLGSHMIQYMIDWAKNTGIVTKINLKVKAENEAGIALYEKMGFKYEGQTSRNFLIDGKYYDSVCMGLEL